MSTKSVSRYRKLLTTQVENLHAVSHFIQHKTLSALNYAQEFGNRVKESLKTATNSKWATFTKSRIVPCQILSAFVSTLNMSLPLVQTMTKEDEVGMGVDWIENFPPVCQQTVRSESTQDKAGSLPPASWDYVMLFSIFSKS